MRRTRHSRRNGRNYAKLEIVVSRSLYAYIILINKIFHFATVIAEQQQPQPNITQLLRQEKEQTLLSQAAENITAPSKLPQQNDLISSLPPTINGMSPFFTAQNLDFKNYDQSSVNVKNQSSPQNSRDDYRQIQNEQIQNYQNLSASGTIFSIPEKVDVRKLGDNNAELLISNPGTFTDNLFNGIPASIGNNDNETAKTEQRLINEKGNLEESFLLAKSQIAPLIRHSKHKSISTPISQRRRAHRRQRGGVARKHEREHLPKFIDIAKKPFAFQNGGKHAASATLNQQKRCQFDDGELWPSATLCDDTLGEDACKSIFGSGGNPRSILCHNPTMDHLVRKCAKTCKVCCEVTKYDCTNSADGVIDCDKHRAKCYDPVWYNVMMVACEHTCGFCDADKCFDAADGCDTLQPLCQHRSFAEVMRVQCALTCGHCKPTTSKMVESLLLSLNNTTNSKNKKKFGENNNREEFTLLKPNTDHCVDRLPTCVLQKKLCDDRRYAALMTEKCAKTCNFCYTTSELAKGSGETKDSAKAKEKPLHKLGKLKKRYKKGAKRSADNSGETMSENDEINFTLSGELITNESGANEVFDLNDFRDLTETPEQLSNADRIKRGFDEVESDDFEEELFSRFEGLKPDEITFIRRLEELDRRDDSSLENERPAAQRNKGRKVELRKDNSAKFIDKSSDSSDGELESIYDHSNSKDDILEAFKEELRKLIETNKLGQKQQTSGNKSSKNKKPNILYQLNRTDNFFKTSKNGIAKTNGKSGEIYTKNVTNSGRDESEPKTSNIESTKIKFQSENPSLTSNSLEDNSESYEFDENGSSKFIEDRNFSYNDLEDDDSLEDFLTNLRKIFEKRNHKQRRNDKEYVQLRRKNVLDRARPDDKNIRLKANPLRGRKPPRNTANTPLKSAEKFQEENGRTSESFTDSNTPVSAKQRVNERQTTGDSEENLKKLLLEVLEKLQKPENYGSETSNFNSPDEEFNAANSEGGIFEKELSGVVELRPESKLDVVKKGKNFNNLKANKSEFIEIHLLESNSEGSNESDENEHVAAQRPKLSQRIQNQKDRRRTVHEISRQLRGLFNSGEESRSFESPTTFGRRRAKRSVGDIFEKPDFNFENFSLTTPNGDYATTHGGDYANSNVPLNLRLSNGSSVRSSFEPGHYFSLGAKNPNKFSNFLPDSEGENGLSVNYSSLFNRKLGEKADENTDDVTTYGDPRYAQGLPSFEYDHVADEYAKNNEQFNTVEHLDNEASREIRFSPNATPFGFEHQQYSVGEDGSAYSNENDLKAETEANRGGFGSAKKIFTVDSQQTISDNGENERFEEIPSTFLEENTKLDTPQLFDNIYSKEEYLSSREGATGNDDQNQTADIIPPTLGNASGSSAEVPLQKQESKAGIENNFDPLKYYLQQYRPNANAFYSENMDDPDSMLFLQAGLSPPLVVYQGDDEVGKNNKEHFAAGGQPGIKDTSDSIENLVDNFETRRPFKFTLSKNRRRKFDGVLRDKKGARFKKSEINIKKAIKKIEKEYGPSKKKTVENQKRKERTKQLGKSQKIKPPKQKISSSSSLSSSSSSQATDYSESSILSKERKITKELKEILHDLIVLKRSKYSDSDDQSNEDLRKFLLTQQKQRKRQEAGRIFRTRQQKNQRRLLLLRGSQDENGEINDEDEDDEFESVERIGKNSIGGGAISPKRKLLLVENRHREPAIVVRPSQRYVIDRNSPAGGGGSAARVVYEAYNPSPTLVRASPNGEPIAFGPRSPPTDYADNVNARSSGSGGPLVLAPRVSQGNLVPSGITRTTIASQSRPSLLNTGGFTHVDVGAGFGPIPAELCKDYYPYCEQITPSGFCASGFYPLKMKREFCPQSCGLC